MLIRILSLIVAFIAPLAALAVLFGDQPTAAISYAERSPCLGLAILALALGTLHALVARDATAAAEAAMWWGLSTYLFVAAFLSPPLRLWAIFALLALAGTSFVRLAARSRRRPVATRSLRRRTYA